MVCKHGIRCVRLEEGAQGEIGGTRDEPAIRFKSAVIRVDGDALVAPGVDA